MLRKTEIFERYFPEQISGFLQRDNIEGTNNIGAKNDEWEQKTDAGKKDRCKEGIKTGRAVFSVEI